LPPPAKSTIERASSAMKRLSRQYLPQSVSHYVYSTPG